MKCLDSEKLISYAYGLLDEAAAAQARAHLSECPSCREKVEQSKRLHAMLDEWTEAGPSPGFDARLGHAIESQRSAASRGFGGLEWARGLAFASLGILIVTLLALTPGRWRGPASRERARHQPQRVAGEQTPARSVSVGARQDAPPATGNVMTPGVNPISGVPAGKSERAGASWTDDNDAQALEDYDLAANFDLLSELPRQEKRVAN